MDTVEIGFFIIAWFVQMGVHEGAHAYAAYACGDQTAFLLGKRTVDPFRHIEWRDLNSVLLGVVMPIYTAMQGYIPMGMAWVPVNPLRFRNYKRDSALVAFAGPAGNFVLAGGMLALRYAAELFSSGGGEPSPVDTPLRAIYITSIVYGVFNLVPIPPLDGSKVVYGILPRALQEIMDSIAPYGFLILIALFWFGNAGVYLSPIIGLFYFFWP